MMCRVVGVAVLISISMLARAGALDDYESSLIAGDYAKARAQLGKMSDASSAKNVAGYKELLRVFESCEAFIALADQHMIAPSSTPIKELESAYDTIGFRESDFSVSDAVLGLLNERLQRARQMMEFAHHESSPVNVNKVAADRETQANQDQAVRTACGLDYHQLKLGMTLDRVRMCVAMPYLINVRYRRGLLMSTYQIEQRYVQVMGYQVVGWVK